MELLYEGKSKQVFSTDNAHQYILKFKNSATAFNAQKKAEFDGKGVLNQSIATLLFKYLEKKGIPTHFIKTVSDTEMLVQAVKIIPIEVVIRNRAAGSLVKRLGLEERKVIEPPLVEFFYKSDPLGDPLITEDHIYMMNWASKEDVLVLRKLGLQINDLLVNLFAESGMILADFKLEFGKNEKGQIILSDEITPDGCRLWDINTFEIMDKDRFRKDLGGLMAAYEKVHQNLKQKVEA